MAQKLWLSTSLLLLYGGAAQAGIIYTSGVGTTVYGATNYANPTLPGAAPTYIANNITGDNDILASPGNGFQTASPVLANNIWESPLNTAVPYFFNALGGQNINGFAFGSGATTVTGPNTYFALSDTNAGCCTASYMITSTVSDFSVDANGYNGSLGAVLGIGGINPTGADSSVVSLIVSYDLNNAGYIALPQMVLAITGDCVNDVLIGGVAGNVAAESNAACTNGGNGGAFSALAVDNMGNFNLAANSTLDVKATFTAYSDPASIDSIAPDLSLLPDVSLPGFDLAAVDAPEPGTLLMLGAGLSLAGLLRRRKN